MPDPSQRCPSCGLAPDRCGCATAGPSSSALRLLPPDDAAREGAASRPDARLIREFKGPTHQDLIDDVERTALLPGRVLRAAQAIEDGDLREADRRLDAAFGAVVAGPGFGRRREWRLSFLVLVALFAILAATTVLLLAATVE